MSRDVTRSKYAIDITAGLIGLLFDRIAGQANGGSAPAEPDDLTVINGIGPTFARRLCEEGVVTYADLAALTPERAREITRVAAWQADPADWIAEAKTLA